MAKPQWQQARQGRHIVLVLMLAAILGLQRRRLQHTSTLYRRASMRKRHKPEWQAQPHPERRRNHEATDRLLLKSVLKQRSFGTP